MSAIGGGGGTSFTAGVQQIGKNSDDALTQVRREDMNCFPVCSDPPI